MAELIIPKHIAFIMDGNGRWAKKRLMPRTYGHKVGAETFKRVVEYCGEIGVMYVTVYAFSTENWKRPEAEVEAIFKLFEEYIEEAEEKSAERQFRIVFIGDKAAFKPEMRQRMEALEEKTSKYPRILNIGINYGGRAEIVNAVNRLIAMGKTEITEQDISENIYTSESPDPDMIVRTGGEYRTSNFMMWQSAYSEFYVTDKLWPDITNEDIDLVVEEYNKRNRRYGGL